MALFRSRFGDGNHFDLRKLLSVKSGRNFFASPTTIKLVLSMLRFVAAKFFTSCGLIGLHAADELIELIKADSVDRQRAHLANQTASGFQSPRKAAFRLALRGVNSVCGKIAGGQFGRFRPSVNAATSAPDSFLV